MPCGCFKKSSVDTKLEKQSFFVITVIFNPASYQSRYALYNKFAQHMKKTGAQLITIECIFPCLNQNKFLVTDSNNPYHIQLKSQSIYWMKENLINIAVSRLPPHAKYVCWLDADITFHEHNWIDLTLKELRKYTVVQVFKKAKFLGPPPHSKVLRTDYSFGYSAVHGKVIDQNRYDEWYPHSGYGWAMDIGAFRSIGGLPEYDIVGSGDLHFAFSLLNRVSNAIEENLNPEFIKYMLTHCQKTFKNLELFSTAEKKGIVGYVPMSISHNWHGSRTHRQYVDRWKILIAHQFNFLTDMTKNPDGLLEFNEWEILQAGGLTKSSLQQDILTHFQMRKEDENGCTDQDRNMVRTKKPVAKKIPLSKNRNGGRSSYDDWRRIQNDNQPYHYDHYIQNLGCTYLADDQLNNHYRYVPDPGCSWPGYDQHYHHYNNLPNGECTYPGYDNYPYLGSGPTNHSDYGSGHYQGDYGNGYNGTVNCSSQY